MTTSTSTVIDHVQASDGYMVPTNILETKRSFNGDQITFQEWYDRGRVYGIKYNWVGDNLIDNLNDNHIKPTNYEEWLNPATYKNAADPSYPSSEYYPWRALKLIAYNVPYSTWVDGSYNVGDNFWG